MNTLQRLTILAALALGAGACDTSSDSGKVFGVESISVSDGAVWQINRPIALRFTQPVDFGTVSLNSINVRATDGTSATGELFLIDSHTVVFQPTCPTSTDYSDAALQPGGVAYELTVVGADLGAGIQSKGGKPLAVSERRNFTTPTSSLPGQIFFDPVVGPPRPIVRGRDGTSLTESSATYVEVGGDPSLAARLYFEETGTGVVLRDAAGQLTELPLNLASDLASQVAAVLFVNQPISPGTADAGSGALRWEYEETPGTWRVLDSQSELIVNCTTVGAELRVTPQGVLPPGTRLRIVMTTAFADLTEDANAANIDDFAIAPTAPPPSPLVDELFEPFLISAGDDPGATLHDFAAALADPPAVWADGRLSPGFEFEGTGGPGANFDVRISAGQFVTWSTISTLIVGGPDFVPANQVVALGGIFDVDDLLIEPGATLKIEGTNPAVILATGNVQILGTLDASGTGSPGVNGLNTTNVPEDGTAGQCGGGQGGAGSPLGSASSPRGARGFGAFNLPDFGGEGGETGWTCDGSGDAKRRGGGGGGGRLGPDQLIATGEVDESWIGLNAEQGFRGTTQASSATAGVGVTPSGGLPGPQPFFDTDPTNNFFGLRVDTVTGNVVKGELTQPWAGAGGGGGGDASLILNSTCTFPNSPFDPLGDEKGSGGGGGGGSLSILAIGSVTWGANGQVIARGGYGGGGESTINVNRIGAGSGGGSGGHVIVQSGLAIDFSQKFAGSAGPPAILATGGQGGVGAQNVGGASPTPDGIETTPDLDSCPDTAVPGCVLGLVVGAGGDGGPGIVQLHSPTGVIGPGGDIVLPGVGVTLADICFPAPVAPLVPQFGRKSRARSIWVRLGLGGYDPSQPTMPMDPTFTFNGTDPLTGAVTTVAGAVPPLPSIMPDTPPPVLQAAPALPFVAADEFTLIIDAASVPVEFSENPNLLLQYWIDLDPTGTQGVSTARYPVVSAAWDPTTDTLALTTSMAGPKLTTPGGPGTQDVRLRPVFFRVESDGMPDVLPDSADVQVTFQAAPADPANGLPDESGASLWVTDVSQLNALGTDYRFIRFEVFFDVDKQAQGIDASLPRPELEFLRIPFRY